MPWGYVGGVQCDPVKSPSFTRIPGRLPAAACSVRVCAARIARALGDLKLAATRLRWHRHLEARPELLVKDAIVLVGCRGQLITSP